MGDLARFTSDDGLTLAYRDTGGERPPVLCLAGLTRNSLDFDDLTAALAPTRRVIRLDSRGRGASDHDPQFMNYNVAREAQDALALLDHLSAPSVTLVGTSRGGLLSMMMTAMRPETVRGVVLNDIGPVMEPVGLDRIRNYLGVPPTAATFEELADQVRLAAAAQFPNVGREAWLDHVRRGYRETDVGLALGYDPKLRDAIEALFAANPEPDLWPLFDALANVPTLLLRGANSDLLTAETMALMQERKPDLRAATVPDRGHVPFLNEREALEPILTFLKDIAS